jgi:hypothetical protein
MSNIRIIRFDGIMEYEIVLQRQVFYLQLHNRFGSLERDWLEHESILKKNK